MYYIGPVQAAVTANASDREPTAAELKAIEWELPLISAEVELLDVEISTLDRPVTEVDARRVRRALSARRALTNQAADLFWDGAA
ncbi:DUF6284 family protein [Streptomyces sp. NPDC001635]|nr:hypothetical protein E4K10_22905 [Streptomyces sp. T1317-0309]